MIEIELQYESEEKQNVLVDSGHFSVNPFQKSCVNKETPTNLFSHTTFIDNLSEDLDYINQLKTLVNASQHYGSLNIIDQAAFLFRIDSEAFLTSLYNLCEIRQKYKEKTAKEEKMNWLKYKFNNW